MAIKLGQLIIRILLFQFVFLFIFSKMKNPQKSIIDFSKRIKFIAKSYQLTDDKIELIENKSYNIFAGLFSLYFISGLFAIFNFNFFKNTAGFITILMAIIYCNPLSTIKKNFEKNRYETQSWKLYIPSLEFILIFCLGLIMMLSSFQSEYDDIKYEEDDKEKDFSEKKKAD